MAITVSLVNFTDQGMRNIEESPQRARAFRELCRQQGVQVREMLWTSGPYDMVLIGEGPEEALSAVLLSAAKLGNVRTQTLRAMGSGNLPACARESQLIGDSHPLAPAPRFYGAGFL